MPHYTHGHTGREYQVAYKKAHKSHSGQETAHILSAESLRYYKYDDHPTNYRMKSVYGNQITDRFVERQMIGGGGFSPGYASYGNRTRYVSNQDCVNRVEQMIGQFTNDTPRMLMRDTYRAARDAGGDLRMFNGLNFSRPR